MRREDRTFLVAGTRCAAWWYTPEGRPPYPAIVLAHGFAGTREGRLDAYAERFAAAGSAAFVFDYRHFGASEGEPRQLLDIGRQLEDWEAALAYVRSLSEVDPCRIALWGTSFSGGHVLAIAARDRRTAACISQVPFVDGLANLRATPIRHSLRLLAAGLQDELRAIAGRAPYLVPAIGPPGTLAAMNTPDAEAGYRALIPPGADWRNEVAARIFLAVGSYRPIRSAGRIHCPLLVCVADRDSVAPPEAAVEAARRAPRGEVRRYPIRHFDIYVGDDFERAVADQIDFLRRHGVLPY